MANPQVYSKLEFYPIDPEGLDVYKLSQSKKWREELPVEICVQMVAISGKHFYIYEPTQLLNGTLVVPIFFYSFRGELYAKCIRPQTTGNLSQRNMKLLIPHPLPYYSDHLVSVRCSDFSLIYSEIIRNGLPVAELFHNSLWGEGWVVLYLMIT